MSAFYSDAKDSVLTFMTVWGIPMAADAIASSKEWSALPDGWMDSGPALPNAEEYGGRDFRNSHPDCDVSARLMSSENPTPRHGFTNTGISPIR